MKRKGIFFICIIIAIICYIMVFPNIALSYSSPDIPIGNWSYQAIEKLAMAGLLSLSGLDTRPMTRIQMAYKIKEAIDNINEENLPVHLALDREYVEYLQLFLYKLINEFRQELILMGVTTVQIESIGDQRALDKFFNFNLGFPVEVEHRFTGIKSKKTILAENENGLRLEDGYNLRTRVHPWLNAFGCLTFSATPTFRFTEKNTELFLEEAAAKFSISNIEFAAAKSAMWWGPGFHGSMLMSNNAKPLNLIRVRTINNFRFPWIFEKLGFWGFNFFISKLETNRTVPEPTFAGLRLEWSPLRFLSLGASRTSIMDGKGRPKLNLKDYWKIFIARGKDEFSPGEIKKTDTDQLASFDARLAIPLNPQLRFASGLELYGEWAGEDRFSFWENESPGFLAGFFLTDIFRDKGTDFKFEYAKTKPAWYIHGLYSAYTYEGEIMGHHMGGDSDDIFFSLSKELPFLSTPYFDSVKVEGQLDIERHGLSLGLQEKKVEFAIDFLWSHSDTVSLRLRYELEDYRNFEYVSGSTSKNRIILIETDIKF